MINQSQIKKGSNFNNLICYCPILCLFLISLLSTAQAQDSNTRGFLGLGGSSSGGALQRKLQKGISSQEVKDNLKKFSDQNEKNLDAGSCSAALEIATSGHDLDSYEDSYSTGFTMGSGPFNSGQACIIKHEYEGNGKKIGYLWKFLGCCDYPYCYYQLYLRADEIAYFWPVNIHSSSNQIFDDMLRVDPSEGGYTVPEIAKNTPTPTPSPTPTRVPGTGGGTVEGHDCNYAKADAIAAQGGYSKEYINWVMSIGERESSFSDAQASDNTLNGDQHIYNSKGEDLINNNVAKGTRPVSQGGEGLSLADAQAKYGDYGYYQNNATDSKYAVSQYGLSEESAKALSNDGGRGNYTVEQQTLAMAEYIEKKYPSAAAAAKNGDYASADEEVDGFWFGAGDPNPCKVKSASTDTLASN